MNHEPCTMNIDKHINAWATLAPFAPAMFDALRAITHPMASDKDLQDALELLAEINAARKSASDAAFVSAVCTNGKNK